MRAPTIALNLFVSAFLLVASAVAQTPPPATTPDNVPSLYVIGDSTANNSGKGMQGWGDPFAAYFDPARIHVINRARAGRSSRTFTTEGLWAKVLEQLKPGDFVLIQFGHNDSGPLDTGRARASLPGLGDESKEVTMPTGTKETVYTYGHYMRGFLADVRAKGAHPYLLSLTVRNIWKDGHVERGSGHFGQWTAELARATNTPFIDVTNLIADRYETLGADAVKGFFPVDYAHTSPAGADLNASAVVAGIKALPDELLATFLSERGRAVAAAPAKAVQLNSPVSR